MLKNTKLYFAFVKYNFVQKELGISIADILENIRNQTGIEESNFPNHLLINSSKLGFKNKYIDKGNIEVFLIDKKDLPSFDTVEMNGLVKNITYSINILDFYKVNQIDFNEVFDAMKEEVLKNE